MDLGQPGVFRTVVSSGVIWTEIQPPGKEDEIVGAVPLLGHLKAFTNLAAQCFLVQVSVKALRLPKIHDLPT